MALDELSLDGRMDTAGRVDGVVEDPSFVGHELFLWVRGRDTGDTNVREVPNVQRLDGGVTQPTLLESPRQRRDGAPGSVNSDDDAIERAQRDPSGSVFQCGHQHDEHT
jgi:hypothetical protein